jgi:hypothetical protein
VKQYEREYFVSRIRSGFIKINYKNLKLKVFPPTIEDELECNEVCINSYNSSLDDGIKTQDEMGEWMMDRGLWSEKDNQKEKGLNKDLEHLRVEIFNARNNQSMKEKIRTYLRKGEQQLNEHLHKKNIYQENTCEGLALLEKSLELIRRCTYVGSELYDFESVDIREIWHLFYNNTCSDNQIRDIAKSEPWRSIWILRDSNSYELFSNNGRELSVDQKNLLVWSRMYDNINESPDCPGDDVIDDDDMLDGWFILQRKKRDKEKLESELDNTINHPKLQNASEVFLMAKTDEDAERIDTINDLTGKMVKRERLSVIKQKGSAEQLDFQDERLKLRRQSNQQYKDKFGR